MNHDLSVHVDCRVFKIVQLPRSSKKPYAVIASEVDIHYIELKFLLPELSFTKFSCATLLHDHLRGTIIILYLYCNTKTGLFLAPARKYFLLSLDRQNPANITFGSSDQVDFLIF